MLLVLIPAFKLMVIVLLHLGEGLVSFSFSLSFKVFLRWLRVELSLVFVSWLLISDILQVMSSLDVLGASFLR